MTSVKDLTLIANDPGLSNLGPGLWIFNKKVKKFINIRKIDKKKMFFKKRVCRFCIDKELPIDYKYSGLLNQFLTERGKIVPSRMSGNCAYHQRVITQAIKRARLLALLPFSVSHSNFLS